MMPRAGVGAATNDFAFADDKGVQVGEATAVSQSLAADIVDFIKQNRADTNFFKLVTSALPDEIFYVPHDKLRQMRVVTDNIWDESWSFEFQDGLNYLKIWQKTLYGEYKLLVSCPKGSLVGWAFFEKPEHLPTPIKLGVFINDEKYFLPDQVLDAENYLTAMFWISRDLANKMLAARSIGVFIQPPNPNVFLGFNIETAKGHDKLYKLITSCHA